MSIAQFSLFLVFLTFMDQYAILEIDKTYFCGPGNWKLDLHTILEVLQTALTVYACYKSCVISSIKSGRKTEV